MQSFFHMKKSHERKKELAKKMKPVSTSKKDANSMSDGLYRTKPVAQ